MRISDWSSDVFSSDLPDLQQQDIGPLFARGILGKGEEGGGRGHFEEGDRLRAVDILAAFQQRDQRPLIDQARGQPDAFVEAYQVRRGVEMKEKEGRRKKGEKEGE